MKLTRLKKSKAYAQVGLLRMSEMAEIGLSRSPLMAGTIQKFNENVERAVQFSVEMPDAPVCMKQKWIDRKGVKRDDCGSRKCHSAYPRAKKVPAYPNWCCRESVSI